MLLLLLLLVVLLTSNDLLLVFIAAIPARVVIRIVRMRSLVRQHAAGRLTRMGIH